jgi:hypothetical protein
MAIQIYDGGVYEIKGLLNSKTVYIRESFEYSYGRFEWYCSFIRESDCY